MYHVGILYDNIWSGAVRNDVVDGSSEEFMTCSYRGVLLEGNDIDDDDFLCENVPKVSCNESFDRTTRRWEELSRLS